jgi:DNA-binding NarL/FixJ family response regulator
MKDADPVHMFEQLNNETPDAKILLLVKEVDPDKISSFIDAGIKGIIKKDCEPDEVLHAIKMLISGKRYFDSDILYEYLKRAGQVKKVPMPEDLVLDQTDMQMIKLIADEYTQVEMNKILELPTSTIMYLRRRLFAKMNVKNTAGLMKKVVQYGLIE